MSEAEQLEKFPEPETWQESWCFHLDQENDDSAAEIRGYLQFGGRLTLKDYFLPRAQDVCRELDLTLVGIDDFKVSVDLNANKYSVSALVTLKHTDSQQ